MIRRFLGLVVLVLGMTACANLPFAPTPTPTPAAPLVIFADDALANVLRDIGAAFTQANPGAQMEWTFAEPNVLRAQIAQGAEPDVVISADARWHENAFPLVARDPLVLVVANANPAQLERVEDLNRDALRVAIADENTTLGQATRALVENFRHDAAFGPDFPARLDNSIVAQADSGRAVLNAVIEKRADVGIVYASQARLEAQRVTVLEIPRELNVSAEFRRAALATTKGAARTQAFLDYLTLPQAQTLWRAYGFEPAP